MVCFSEEGSFSVCACVGTEGLGGGEQSNTMVTLVTSVSPVGAEESHLSETVVEPFRPDSSVRKRY